MITKRIFWICAIATCACCASWQLNAQTSSGLTATIQFSKGQTLTTTDFSQPIGVQVGELVNITLQFPPGRAGEPVTIEALNGGSTSAGSGILAVNPDGSVNFAFVAPAAVGSKSVNIHKGSENFLLRFSVDDATRP